MKKLFSLLLCVVMIVSVFSSTASAATQTPLFSMSTDKTDVTTNDEIVVTLAHATQNISSLAAYLKYDPAVLELVSIYDGYGEIAGSEDADFGMWYTTKKYMDVNIGAGQEGWSVFLMGNLNGETKEVTGNDNYALITFKVIATASTTSKLEMYEGWDYLDPTTSAEVKQPADTLVDTETITVTVESEDVIVNDEKPVTDDATETKKWENVSVTAGLVGEGKIKAVLSYDDGVTQKTQNVALTFGDGLEFTGEGSLVFDVIVHFQAYANAPYTNLEIVKVTE